MTLSTTEQKFILHWGEMGTRWGISRAVAQVHAVLLLSAMPLNAEEISTRLELARSNVSTAVRELQTWGVIRITHVLGDRRDHFEATRDAWEMLAVIAEKRLEREILPTIQLLSELEKTGPPLHQREFLSELRGVLESGVLLFRKLRGAPVKLAKRFLRADARLFKLLGHV